MTVREKIRHAARRLAFGSTVEELDRFERIGLNATIAELTDFSPPGEKYPVSPFEYFYQEDGQIQTQAQRVSAWWLGRMALTTKPQRDKLLLFLHDHFAISADKVESGALLLTYLQTMEDHLQSPFDELLKAVTIDPAMLIWLDLRESIKDRPNENFARELLELFTLGIGNYTEADIKEASRALTGWGIRNLSAEVPREQVRGLFDDWAKGGSPLVVPSFSPQVADASDKTILGKTQKFNLDSVIELASQHPVTAKYLCTKLWEFYAYENPEPKVVDRLSKVFLKSKGKLTDVVAEIAKMDEFYSDKAHRAIVKCPIDFFVPVVRSVITPAAAFNERPARKAPTTPVNQAVATLSSTLLFLCNRVGMTPMFPPDVAGWNWGTSWISTTTMLDRINFSRVFAGTAGGRSMATQVSRIAARKGVTDSLGVMEVLFEVLDANPSAEERAVFADMAQKANLGQVVGNIDQLNSRIGPLVRGVFAMPTFHLC
ncbi:DUF1800 domain-containing protein [Kamptonema cortianum]|nr:DUF1800 domain-containing protein [Kamptonema cortianum]